MVEVTFVTAEGARVRAEAAVGARLLEVAQGAGMPLEGTCEGQMACSTCHVIVAAAAALISAAASSISASVV